MVGTEDAALVRQKLAEQPQGPPCVTHLAAPVGDVVAGQERVGVVGAQHPLPAWQQLAEQP